MRTPLKIWVLRAHIAKITMDTASTAVYILFRNINAENLDLLIVSSLALLSLRKFPFFPFFSYFLRSFSSTSTCFVKLLRLPLPLLLRLFIIIIIFLNLRTYISFVVIKDSLCCTSSPSQVGLYPNVSCHD